MIGGSSGEPNAGHLTTARVADAYKARPFGKCLKT